MLTYHFLSAYSIIVHVFTNCNHFILIFMNESVAITNRLLIVMDGRERYPWAQSIGVGRGSIEGIWRGSIPGGETLSAIARCENARIDWILDGRGAPFTVTCVTSDEDAADLLNEHCGEKMQWNCTIVTDGKRIAVVLDQEGMYQVKDGKDAGGAPQFRDVRYSAMEVIVGIVGALAMDVVRPGPKNTVGLVNVDVDTMARIVRGQVGTWRMLKSPDAILSSARRIGASDPFFSQFNQQELFPTTPDEAILLDHYRAMAPQHRSAVNQIVTAMEKHGDAAAVKSDDAPAPRRARP